MVLSSCSRVERVTYHCFGTDTWSKKKIKNYTVQSPNSKERKKILPPSWTRMCPVHNHRYGNVLALSLSIMLTESYPLCSLPPASVLNPREVKADDRRRPKLALLPSLGCGSGFKNFAIELLRRPLLLILAFAGWETVLRRGICWLLSTPIIQSRRWPTEDRRWTWPAELELDVRCWSLLEVGSWKGAILTVLLVWAVVTGVRSWP